MTQAHPITQLIDSWPTRKALADEIGANVEAVHKWAQGKRIPYRWHREVAKAAAAKGITYATPAWLADVYILTPSKNTGEASL